MVFYGLTLLIALPRFQRVFQCWCLVFQGRPRPKSPGKRGFCEVPHGLAMARISPSKPLDKRCFFVGTTWKFDHRKICDNIVQPLDVGARHLVMLLILPLFDHLFHICSPFLAQKPGISHEASNFSRKNFHADTSKTR